MIEADRPMRPLQPLFTRNLRYEANVMNATTMLMNGESMDAVWHKYGRYIRDEAAANFQALTTPKGIFRR